MLTQSSGKQFFLHDEKLEKLFTCLHEQETQSSKSCGS